ncbi:MAG: cell division protein FtsX [Acidimicrobiales bacterium]
MLSRIGYVLRETGASLRRNLTLTLATLLTVLVALSLVGLSILIQRGMSNQLARWEGGVEISIFMNPTASADQIDKVRRDLEENQFVRRSTYVDKAKAAEEVRQLFPRTPEILEAVTEADLPTSFRVVPTSTDQTLVSTLVARFQRAPGVMAVYSANEVIDFLRNVSSYLNWALALAVVLGLGAVLLIWNTIRTAMFARRREIEVMKLVGATNWFIRWPFMLEGMILGFLGASLASAAMWGFNQLWKSRVIDEAARTNLFLDQLQATPAQVNATVIILLVVGTVAGAVASAIAATRFLDV